MKFQVDEHKTIDIKREIDRKQINEISVYWSNWGIAYFVTCITITILWTVDNIKFIALISGRWSIMKVLWLGVEIVNGSKL
jgi:hypothetical protein